MWKKKSAVISSLYTRLWNFWLLYYGYRSKVCL